MNKLFWVAMVVAALFFPLAGVAAEPVSVSNSVLSNEIVVKQGEVAVTLADIDAWMQEVPEKDRIGFINSPERIEAMLTQLLLMKQAVKEAHLSGIANDPMVKAHIQLATERVLARYQLDHFAKSVQAPDFAQLAQEKFLADPEPYRATDVATVVHVLIDEQKRSPEAAEKLVNKLHRQAIRNPKKLEDMALRYSDDPSVASNRGVLPPLKLNEVDPEFAKGVQSLKVGEISPPVKSQFGWHIIRLDSFERGKLPEFEAVKAKMVEQLEKEYRSNTIRGYSERLKQSQPLEPNPEVLESLRSRYGEAPDLNTVPTAQAKAPETASEAETSDTVIHKSAD